MNKNKGFRRLIAILSALLLALGILGTMIDLDRIWVIWGVICSAGVWIIYGLILYIIKGFTDTNSFEISQTPALYNVQANKPFKIPKAIIKEIAFFFVWIVNKPIKAISCISMQRWITIICFLAAIITVFYACTHMIGAGDTWVSMANGRHYINHGVNTVEPFNFNSRKAGPGVEDISNWPQWAQWITDKAGLKTVQYWHPTGYVNHRWLGDVLFYWLSHKSLFADAGTFDKPISEQNISYNTIVYLKFTIYLIVFIIVYYTGKNLGLNRVLATISACLALLIGRSLLDTRTVAFSNMLAAMLMFVFVLTLYKNYRFIWLIVPIMVLWCNVYEGYVYYCLLFVPFAGLIFFLTKLPIKTFRSIFKTVDKKGSKHIIWSLMTAFLSIIIFNPFHLTNITHAVVSMFGKDSKFWKAVNEWHPAFEWNNPVGNEIPFTIMVAAGILVLLIWIIYSAVILLLRLYSYLQKLHKKKTEQMQLQGVSTYTVEESLQCEQDNIEGGKDLSKGDTPNKLQLDIILPAVAATAIYLAYRHRLFIPMAAIISCPVIVMLFRKTICHIAKATGLEKIKWIITLRWFYITQRVGTAMALCLIILMGMYTGAKFKTVYLNPWPGSSELASIFMRMTGSYGKPFKACQFMRDNNIQGKIFNCWTDGGFIAYSQIPDANTGRTPLLLFIDGRAYTAYDADTFQRWHNIMCGSGAYKNPKPTYFDIGKWIDEEFTKEKIWIVLMPSRQFNSDFVRGLEARPNWLPVYMDDQQKLLVDINSEQGKSLYTRVFLGKIKFPDDFSQRLTVGHILLKMQGTENVGNGYTMMIDAFKQRPCNASAAELIDNIAAPYPQMKDKIAEIFSSYLADFEKNKKAYAQQHGYLEKITSAMIAASYLKKINANSIELFKKYETSFQAYSDERDDVIENSRW